MEIIIQYFNAAVELYGSWGLALMVLVLVFFTIQMRYYLGIFRRLPGFKIRSQESTGEHTAGISVVVAMGDDYLYIENVLPTILQQDCELFEVVVVYVGTNGDFYETLETMATVEDRLVVSRIKQHPLFPISTKMALNIGIKAARFENIVVTTPDAHPVSPRWLSLLEQGFRKGGIVIGYCGIEPSRGLADKIIRSSRMFSSLLYISAAILRKPYRGSIRNVGFTKSLYFDNKGFGNLNLNLGEDDLFLQQIFSEGNYTIVMHPRATVRQMRWGGLGWWFHERRLQAHTYPLYPARAKAFIVWESASRMFFFMTAAATIVLMPFAIQMAAVGLVVLRFVAVMVQMRRVAQRLGEKRLMSLYFINDFTGPLYDLLVAVSCKLKPIREVWR